MKRLLVYLLCAVLALTSVLAPLSVAAAEQLPPPVVAQITASTIWLERRSGYEYSTNGVSWSTLTGFGDLLPETEYRFYQRRAGQPDTQSEPLIVKTPAKTPSTTAVVPPVLDYAGTDFISLVDRSDYEYRINGGNWQSSPAFFDLQPDTEYVLEQRVRSMRGELASEPSVPLKVKTHKRGPSSYVNFAKVQDFIDTYGTETEDGLIVMGYVIEDEAGAEYIIGIGNNGNGIDMELFYDGVEEFGLAFDVQLTLYPKNWNFDSTFDVIVVDGNTILDEIDATALIEEKEYNADYVYPVYKNGDYLTKDEAAQLATLGLQILFGFWDEVFYTELGFGLKGLGFTAYEGYGEDFCDPKSGHHLGSIESSYQRDPSCGTYGRTATTSCTLCGEKVSLGKYIEPTIEHTYDNGCDGICNTCGFGIFTQHRYTYACSSACSICGAEREPLHEHRLIASGLCTVCGVSTRLLGDVSGDGRINMGDVSKLYSHIKGNSVITDSVTLDACDVNGDGKINIGDISRLYSHIKGTDPLS